MKRPQRYLLMILSSAAVAWIVLRLMSWRIALGVGVAIAVIGLVLAVCARHQLVGQYRERRRDWGRAIESYRRFEKLLLMNSLSGWLLPFYVGVYTIDGVAWTRNRIAQALMHLNRLDDAEGWLRSALQRDPLYALPYVHRGTIAALRKENTVAHRHFQKAVDLGYSPQAAEQQLRRARQRASEAAETPFDDRSP